VVGAHDLDAELDLAGDLARPGAVGTSSPGGGGGARARRLAVALASAAA
jgi:hypothetical protein